MNQAFPDPPEMPFFWVKNCVKTSAFLLSITVSGAGVVRRERCCCSGLLLIRNGQEGIHWAVNAADVPAGNSTHSQGCTHRRVSVRTGVLSRC